MDLTAPRPKKGCRLPKPTPLPLISSENGSIYCFQGFFDGFSVSVRDSKDMDRIVSMGSFGKANLSRSYPHFDGNLEKPELIRRRQYHRRKKWGETFGINKTKKVIVVPDSDDECGEYFTNLQAQYEIDRCGNKETVNLMLEEAFFLQKALGCLEIIYESKLLDDSETWELFSQCDKLFQYKYAAYYHFRCKNWVVKPGIKFGGDFLLYKEGPPYYHASYVVLIQTSQKDECKIEDTTSLMGLHRMCETAGKELLICQLCCPDSAVHPEDLSNIEIKEILMKRWVSSQERQDKN